VAGDFGGQTVAGLGADKPVFGVPRVGEAAVGGEVAVKVVGEHLWGLGDEEAAGLGGDEVGAGGVAGGEDGGDLQGLEDRGEGVVGPHAPVEEGGLLHGRGAVDEDRRAGVGRAAHGGVARKAMCEGKHGISIVLRWKLCNRNFF